MTSLPPPTPLEPVPLSPVESIFSRLEDRFVGAFRVTVLLWLDGVIEGDLLAPALQRLQHRHPKLRAAIVEGRDRRLRYHLGPSVPPIPFQIIDGGDEEPPWREQTRRLLRLVFPATGPLAAVTVLRSRSSDRSVLLISAHHAIADGRSAVMLADELLTEYAALQSAGDAPARAPLPIVTAAHARTSAGWADRWRLVRRFIRLQRADRTTRQTPLAEAPAIPPQSQWTHWRLSRQQTVALVRRCRREQASLGAAALAAVCCALMDVLPAANGLFKCQIPFDLREELDGPYGPVTDRDLGCFVSVMNEYYRVSRPPVFWNVARQAHQDVQEFVQQGGPSLYYNIASALWRLFALPDAIRRRVGRPVVARPPAPHQRVTLLTTNYGVLDIRDSYGTLRPRSCTLMFRHDEIGPFLILEALVMGQCLNIGFAADALDPVLWTRLQASVRRHLEVAAGADAADQPATAADPAPAESAPQRTSVAPHE